MGGAGFGPGGLAGSSIVHNFSLAAGVTKTFSSSPAGRLSIWVFQIQSRCAQARRRHYADATLSAFLNAEQGDNFTSGLGRVRYGLEPWAPNLVMVSTWRAAIAR